jgi:hypothetical protein
MRVRPGIGILLFLIAGAGCTNTNTTTPTATSEGQTATPAAAHHATTIQWEKYSDDVFTRAKQQNKLVLIDLEAVWCHWCHVQDEKTYTDPKVIELMNAHVIAVKVDQDSRPDLSNRYEEYGWPATILFNQDGQEIAKRKGYIAKEPMASMLEAFIRDPRPGPSIVKSTEVVFDEKAAISPAARKDLQDAMDKGYDAKEGSWGFVLKFINWDAAEYSLMRARAGDQEAQKRLRKTLDGSLKIIDPVWGGIYQYSTDRDWDHPHFEKLMQFQSELLRTYAMADLEFHEPRYRKAADAIRGFIGKFLTSPDGGFYVSQDADLVQGEHSGEYFKLDDAGRRKLGIPRVDTHRYSRENGWAIRGLLAYYADAQDPADLEIAKKAAEWVISNRSLDGGGFRHDEKDAAGPFLGDTLEMGRAFLALYEATGDRMWLKRAEAAADFITQFRAPAGDKQAAGFATALSPGNPLRPLPQIDENIAAARFFNLLNRYGGRKEDKAAADEAMRYLSAPQLAKSRGNFIPGLLIADTEVATEPLHVTIVGKKSDPAAKALYLEALKVPSAYKRVEWFDAAEGKLPNADVEYPTFDKAAAFVCEGTTCSSPMFEPAKFAERLAKTH